MRNRGSINLADDRFQCVECNHNRFATSHARHGQHDGRLLLGTWRPRLALQKARDGVNDYTLTPE